MLDKEPIRRWLIERGFMGEGELPEIDDAYRLSLREHYLKSASRITGESYNLDDSDPVARISRNLKSFYKL
jgi:phosphoribosylaminoimidazole-succinocarboxamide synthase